LIIILSIISKSLPAEPHLGGHGIAAGAGPGGPASGPAGAASAVSPRVKSWGFDHGKSVK